VRPSLHSHSPFPLLTSTPCPLYPPLSLRLSLSLSVSVSISLSVSELRQCRQRMRSCNLANLCRRNMCSTFGSLFLLCKASPSPSQPTHSLHALVLPPQHQAPGQGPDLAQVSLQTHTIAHTIRRLKIPNHSLFSCWLLSPSLLLDHRICASLLYLGILSILPG
jgi:hypothetical protein